MALRDEIRRVIEESGVVLAPDLDDDASLIRSGVLDSTALFQLVLWAEERTGGGLDLTTFELAEDWDTVAKLAAFIAARSNGRA